MRAELPSHQGIALRLAIAQMIAGCELWAVQAEPQKPASEAIGESLSTNRSEAAFAEERVAVMALLELADDGDTTLVPRKGDWQVSRDVHAIFTKLASLEDRVVTRILTFVVAETLASGSAMVEALGVSLNLDLVANWLPDETFFDLLRDKQAINAMLKDIGGKVTADAHVSSTAKVQKKIIRDYLDGTREHAKADWHPRYARFPFEAYTKGGGLSAIANWKAVKKHYAA